MSCSSAPVQSGETLLLFPVFPAIKILLWTRVTITETPGGLFQVDEGHPLVQGSPPPYGDWAAYAAKTCDRKLWVRGTWPSSLEGVEEGGGVGIVDQGTSAGAP